jgi:hypothetical protein
LESAGGSEKCRLQGPTTDLLDRNPHFNLQELPVLSESSWAAWVSTLFSLSPEVDCSSPTNQVSLGCKSPGFQLSQHGPIWGDDLKCYWSSPVLHPPPPHNLIPDSW